jgi:hypothetical protein
MREMDMTSDQTLAEELAHMAATELDRAVQSRLDFSLTIVEIDDLAKAIRLILSRAIKAGREEDEIREQDG